VSFSAEVRRCGMSPVLQIGLSVVLVVALVFIGLAVGWALWGRQLWSGWGYGMGPGMMNGWNTWVAPSTAPRVHWGCGGSSWGYDEPVSGELTMEQAREAVEQYVESLGYSDLEIVEVMEFEHNFYAIAREAGSGVGAMELLVDKWDGGVSPEIGPNMMWNERYGMHGRGGMRGGT
jgi:hypothetical protein